MSGAPQTYSHRTGVADVSASFSLVMLLSSYHAVPSYEHEQSCEDASSRYAMYIDAVPLRDRRAAEVSAPFTSVIFV